MKGLDVASRTSSFQFKGRDLGVPEIAEKLNVRHVVEGSVRKAGDTLRITAQLIDTKTDRHLWSETFDRPLTTENIFTIQDEIARAIVKALNQTMGTGAAPQVTVVPATNDLTAYDLFLQARPLFLARHDLDKAEALLTRAVEQDPHYADAAFAGYRRSKLFKTTVKNFGVYDYWRQLGFPPQCRAVGADDFACD